MRNGATVANLKPLDGVITVASMQSAPFTLSLKLRMRLWGFIQSTLFRWSPGYLRGFRRWLLRSFGATLVSTASIHNKARIDCPWNLEMGQCASIGEDAWIYSLDKVVLRDFACVGQRSVLLTGTHNFSDPTFTLITKPILIGYGAWIAVGVTILPGVKIGALSVVGAGSVVTKDTPEQMVCAGNPCKPIKRREFNKVDSRFQS